MMLRLDFTTVDDETRRWIKDKRLQFIDGPIAQAVNAALTVGHADLFAPEKVEYAAAWIRVAMQFRYLLDGDVNHAVGSASLSRAAGLRRVSEILYALVDELHDHLTRLKAAPGRSDRLP
jgi:hypothetical protein